MITYIRQEWGTNASEVTVATIDEYTALYAGRSTPWQAADLKEGLGPIPAVVVPVVEGASAESESATTESVDAVH